MNQTERDDIIKKIENDDIEVLSAVSSKIIRSIRGEWKEIIFTDKNIKKIRAKIARIGERNLNRYGTEMMVYSYRDSNNISVRFCDENSCVVDTSYRHFKNGHVQNPFDKSVRGIGFIGLGPHQSFRDNKLTSVYLTWANMISRCYSTTAKECYPSYAKCTVVLEWHNFQNFARWYEENFYQIQGEAMELDKDILVKGNKIYSPSTCCIVPKSINSLFSHMSKKKKLPIGISKKGKSKYTVQCRNRTNGNLYLGLFGGLDEAFIAYKTFKENLIKEVAEEHKSKIPVVLYDALIKYNVEEND